MATDNEVPTYELPTMPPPNPGRTMPQAAAVMGADLDFIDSGGQDSMARPEPDRRPSGPLAATLAERLTGSAQAVDAAATSVGQREDSAANARTTSKG